MTNLINSDSNAAVFVVQVSLRQNVCMLIGKVVLIKPGRKLVSLICSNFRLRRAPSGDTTPYCCCEHPPEGCDPPPFSVYVPHSPVQGGEVIITR